MQKTRIFKGIPVSPGIAIGHVHRVIPDHIDVPKFSVTEREVSTETLRFQKALQKTHKQLAQIKERLCKFQAGDQTKIIESHQMFVQDQILTREVLENIREEKINAEWAFHRVFQKFFDQASRDLANNKNDYFQQRYQELGHVAHRILKNLMGSEPGSIHQFHKDSIVVAHDLSPTDTVQMTRGLVQGFVTETGGPTSHTAIIARALEIPAVCGLDHILRHAKEGDTILIDGTEGLVLLYPSKNDLIEYRETKRKYDHFEQLLLKDAHLPSITKDGYAVRLAANIELLDEIQLIKSHGAEGIGLFRTEMPFIKLKRFPLEEEQFETYREVLRRTAPACTTIRTLDIGGDKDVPEVESDPSENPALGLRAIRYCLKEKSVLKNQLRAMIRASRYGPLKILIPMITNLDEIRQVKRIIADIREDFVESKIPFDAHFKLGAMIEIPSAALMASELAQELDFLSIGTNDLIQYTLAVDRINEEVSYLYEPFHPAILRLLKMICDAGRSHNTEVSLCGEMAGDPNCLLLLIGLGLSELSMNPLSIPKAKKLIRSLTFRQARELLGRAIHCRTATEVEHLVKREAFKISGFPTI